MLQTQPSDLPIDTTPHLHRAEGQRMPVVWEAREVRQDQDIGIHSGRCCNFRLCSGTPAGINL
jgi:hypothetical protein